MMTGMRALAMAVTLVAAGCGGRASSPAVGNRSTAAPESEGAPGIPAEVEAFVERWQLCQHWAGEEPYDAARRAEIQRGVDESCPGNDQARAELERRYADRPDVLARLNALDDP